MLIEHAAITRAMTMMMRRRRMRVKQPITAYLVRMQNGIVSFTLSDGCVVLPYSSAISKYSRYDNFRFLPLFGNISIFT